jgi:hypothetical protein
LPPRQFEHEPAAHGETGRVDAFKPLRRNEIWHRLDHVGEARRTRQGRGLAMPRQIDRDHLPPGAKRLQHRAPGPRRGAQSMDKEQRFSGAPADVVEGHGGG